MGSFWSSTLLMTVSRLSWMNCPAAISPTKTYWTRRSGWDWGRTSHGESDDSLTNADGPVSGPDVPAGGILLGGSLG
jgi:hypothetical protein